MPGSSIVGGTSDEAGAGRHAGVDIFVDAVQGALSLVHADGGEIAILDPALQLLVTRARMTHPRFDAASGAPGVSQVAPGRSSVSPASRAGPASRVPGASSRGGEFESQSTMVLPASGTLRTYRPGEGLIGLVAQRGEPLLIGREEYHALARGSAEAGAPELDAVWHVAVPIFRPGALATSHGETGLLGVISVYNRDPHWSFTQRDAELLMLHADRVARTLALEEQRRRTHLEGELAELLRDIKPADLLTRLRDILRRKVDAPSLAVVRSRPGGAEVVFELAEREGKPLAPFRMAARALPPWWSAVSQGRFVHITSAEDRAELPQWCVAGWGGNTPVLSLMAAPITRGSSPGALVVASPRSDVYGPEQAQDFEALARVAATFLDEAQRATAQTRSEPLAAFIDALQGLNSSLDLAKTLETLAMYAAQVTAAQAAVVFLLGEDERHLTARARSRRNADETVETLPAGELRLPLAWRDLAKVLSSGQFLPLDRLDGDWSDQTEVGRFLAQEQIASAVVVPIVQRRAPDAKHPPRALGVLMVYTPKQRQPFPGQGLSQEVAKLQGLASQAGTAISNAMLYQRQKEVDRLKDEFILTVSHEFRTPLTTIDGYVSLMARHRDKLDAERLQQFTEEIRLASQQLAGMIQMLADAARLSDAGESLKVTLGSVTLREAAESALSTQAPEAKERVTVRIPESLAVFADAERLPVIFSNLIGNALKYAKTGPIEVIGRIEPREALARQGRAHPAEKHAAPRWVVVSVRDRGPGIDPADFDKLFQKFVRLQKSLTTDVRGTGLGLWICREYVQAMGGDIWVESEVNQGADFQFCLPLDATGGASAGPKSGA